MTPPGNPAVQFQSSPRGADYFFFAARTFAQRARAAAAIFARAAALMVRFFLAGLPLARTFAQRALAAAEIFRRAAALIVHFFLGGLPTGAAEPPARFSNLAESFSICCFKAIMRFNLAVDRFSSPVIGLKTMRDYSISLVSKYTTYCAIGGGCNPVAGGAGDAGGNMS
jgi:hypothetical protein